MQKSLFRFQLLRSLISTATVVAFASMPLAAEDQRTIIEFTKTLDEVNVPRHLFGVFRDDKQTPQEQFIQEDFVLETLPTGGDMGFLRLAYVLNKTGTYNGWWLKTRASNDADKEADWSHYRSGAMVLRLRKGSQCTGVFKLEIKTNNGRNVYPTYVRLGGRYLHEHDEKGYADVVVPLSAIVDPNEPLTQVSEVVVVLEESRVTETRGNLLVHSLRLVNKVP